MRKYLLIALLCCVPGCLVPTPGFLQVDVNTKTESKVVAKEVTTLDTDMAKALEGKTIEEHESLYKVFKGASEFAKNAKNVDMIKSVEVKTAMQSVMEMYDVYNKFKIKDIVTENTRTLTMPSGLTDTVSKLKDLELAILANEKQTAPSESDKTFINNKYKDFSDNTTVREILIKTYDDLANAVKYSAEHLKGK